MRSGKTTGRKTEHFLLATSLRLIGLNSENIKVLLRVNIIFKKNDIPTRQNC